MVEKTSTAETYETAIAEEITQKPNLLNCPSCEGDKVHEYRHHLTGRVVFERCDRCQGVGQVDWRACVYCREAVPAPSDVCSDCLDNRPNMKLLREAV